MKFILEASKKVTDEAIQAVQNEMLKTRKILGDAELDRFVKVLHATFDTDLRRVLRLKLVLELAGGDEQEEETVVGIDCNTGNVTEYAHKSICDRCLQLFKQCLDNARHKHAWRLQRIPELPQDIFEMATS